MNDAPDAFLHGWDDGVQQQFSSSYKTHTHFASEHKTQIFRGSTPFGQRCSITLERGGDLVHTCLLMATVRRGDGEAWYPMEQLCTSVEVWIGGQKIEEHPRTWFRLYDELYRDASEREAYKQMTNFDAQDPPGWKKTMFMPLLFWFCRDRSKALPLISLSQQEVELVFNLSKDVPGLDPTFDPIIGVVGEYIFLNVRERQLMETMERQVVIELLQTLTVDLVGVGDGPKTYRIDLDSLRHPCTSLIWCLVGDAHGVFTGSGMPLEDSEAHAPVARAHMSILGHEREMEHPGAWYRAVNNYVRSRRIPSAGVYVWDFGLWPASGTPSGSINMSKLDKVVLSLTTKTGVSGTDPDVTLRPSEEHALEGIRDLKTLLVFAPCWNVLRFKDGMAGLRFSD